MRKQLTTIVITILISLSLAVMQQQSVSATQGKKLNITLIGDSYSAGNGGGGYTGVPNCYRSQHNWAQRYIHWRLLFRIVRALVAKSKISTIIAISKLIIRLHYYRAT